MIGTLLRRLEVFLDSLKTRFVAPWLVMREPSGFCCRSVHEGSVVHAYAHTLPIIVIPWLLHLPPLFQGTAAAVRPSFSCAPLPVSRVGD